MIIFRKIRWLGCAALVFRLFPAALSDVYDLNREFRPVPYQAGAPTAEKIRQGVLSLSGRIPMEPVVVEEIEWHEYEGMAIAYDSELEAWGRAISSRVFRLTQADDFLENAGMVSVSARYPGAGWNAYLHLLQNRLAFYPATNRLYSPTPGVTGVLGRVSIASLGDWMIPNPEWQLFGTNMPKAFHVGPITDWTALAGTPATTNRAARPQLDRCGKLIPTIIAGVNDGDCDADGILDFADGYNLDGISGTSDDQCDCRLVTPWRLELPSYLDIDCLRLDFWYERSDPYAINTSNAVIAPAPGSIRVWRVDASGERHLLYGQYAASDLGLQGTNRCVDLEIEGIAPSTWFRDWYMNDLMIYVWGEGSAACSNHLHWANFNVVEPDADNLTAIFAEPYEQARIQVVNAHIGMDGDRDGEIVFSTPKDLRYEFWVNDDHDGRMYLQTEMIWVEDDVKGAPDCQNDTIGFNTVGLSSCKRDLEDFTRLHIAVDDALTAMTGVTYFLRFDSVAAGSPTVNLFKAVQPNMDYLMVSNVANEQIKCTKLMSVGTNEVQLTNTLILVGTNVTSFLLEGAAVGRGDLTFIVKVNGAEILRKAVDLELRNIETFYERYVVNALSKEQVNASAGENLNDTTYVPILNQYVLHVHGWNMPEWEKTRWTETIFKRLWWQGYRGRVGAFQWPTFTGRTTYDASEIRAWRSAPALASLLSDLDRKYPGQIRVLAHSMGNVVMGEGLRLSTSKVVHTYIAAQAAISAHCYDSALPRYYRWHDTPHMYAHFPSGQTSDPPYLASVTNRVGALVSYFNPVDHGLKWWRRNNWLKPDMNYWYTDGDDQEDTYLPDQGDRLRYDNKNRHGDERDLTLSNDVPEMFARIIESRSQPLGCVSNVAGFMSSVDLRAYKYDKRHYSHSKQFRSNIVDEWDVWKIMAENAELKGGIK